MGQSGVLTESLIEVEVLANPRIIKRRNKLEGL